MPINTQVRTVSPLLTKEQKVRNLQYALARPYLPDRTYWRLRLQLEELGGAL